MAFLAPTVHQWFRLVEPVHDAERWRVVRHSRGFPRGQVTLKPSGMGGVVTAGSPLSDGVRTVGEEGWAGNQWGADGLKSTGVAE